MLQSLKDRLQEARVQEIIAYAIFPDANRSEQVIQEYMEDGALHIYGEEADEDLIGILGFSINNAKELEVKHIAVAPEYREHGYGRDMMLELIGLMKPTVIFAETDEEAVDFYRNIGFTAYSLGEKYPNVERFRCEYVVDEVDE